MRLQRGVHTTAERPARLGGRPHAVDCLATLLFLDRPGAVVSHGSAARLLGLPVSDGLERTVRLTDPDQWRRGSTFRMNRAPLDADEVVRRGPLRLTSPARTLVDCAREWELEHAVVAMDAALLAGATTAGELVRVAAAQHCWRGTPRSRRAVGLADGRAESPLETRGRLRLVGSGLPAPELQVEIRSQGRLVGVVDAWFDGAAVAVEFDGRVTYTDPWRDRTARQVLWEEKRREDKLRALGTRVVRIVDADLGDRWPTLAAEVAALLAIPGPAVRRFTATARARGRRRSA
nr:hypothetical protein [Geodermatophilus saharensis]